MSASAFLNKMRKGKWYMRQSVNGKKMDYISGYTMILPLVLGLWSVLFFTLFLKCFMTVFMRLVLLIKTKWVGLENYIQMFHDSTMWHALFNTMRYVLVIVAISNYFVFTSGRIFKYED